MFTYAVGLLLLCVSLLPTVGLAEGGESGALLIVVGLQGETLLLEQGSLSATWLAQANMDPSDREGIRAAMMGASPTGTPMIYVLTDGRLTPQTLEPFSSAPEYEYGLNGNPVDKAADILYDELHKAPVYIPVIEGESDGPVLVLGPDASKRVSTLQNALSIKRASYTLRFPFAQESTSQMESRFPSKATEIRDLHATEWKTIGRSSALEACFYRLSETSGGFLFASRESGKAEMFNMQGMPYTFDEAIVFHGEFYEPTSATTRISKYSPSRGSLVSIDLPRAQYQILYADEDATYLCRVKSLVPLADALGRGAKDAALETSVWRVPISTDSAGDPQYVMTFRFQPFRFFAVPEKFWEPARRMIASPDTEKTPGAETFVATVPDVERISARVLRQEGKDDMEPAWYLGPVSAYYESTHSFPARFRDKPFDFEEEAAMLNEWHEKSPFRSVDPKGPLPEGLPKAVRAPNGDGTYAVFTLGGDGSGRYTYHDLDTITRYRGEPLFDYDEESGVWSLKGLIEGTLNASRYFHVFPPDDEGVVTLDWDHYVTKILCIWNAAQRAAAADE